MKLKDNHLNYKNKNTTTPTIGDGMFLLHGKIPIPLDYRILSFEESFPWH